MTETSTISAACQRVEEAMRHDARYAATSSLSVSIDGAVVYDEHYRGPVRNDVFSVTKSVVATLVGVAVRDGTFPGLDDPIGAVLELADLPAARQSWRSVLTMTRGCRVDGPWDIDEVTALQTGWLRHIAAAPQLDLPGSRFRYDNAGAHLVLRPDALRSLGQLWLDGGSFGGAQLVDPAYLSAMTTRQTDGGPPEYTSYGYLTWVDRDRPDPSARVILAGGWAGQHLLVVPRSRAVVVTTGDPGFEFGPPPHDLLPPDWRPLLHLLREHLLPLL